MYYIGIDIGGTKCAVVKGDPEMGVVEKISFPTVGKDETLEKIFTAVESLMPCKAIGISCGGPLDEKNGIILSPPNLPGWDEVHITKMLEDRFHVPAKLCNDANACALAEWRMGAGAGSNNMVFLTFGTGLGAGIITDGRLYSGANGNAGEVGHIRMAEDGPIGYGKCGSLEGFCSGGGITRLAQSLAEEALKKGAPLSYAKTADEIVSLTTKHLAELALGGDTDAKAVFDISAEKLGHGLSQIIDTLNPEVIVIGSVYARSEALFKERMMTILEKEALSTSLNACKILPAKLGDSIGDLASLCVALEAKGAFTPNKTTYLDNLCTKSPELEGISEDIKKVISAIISCYTSDGKVLLVGNGGSAADCEHISGELLKGFLSKRCPNEEEKKRLSEAIGKENALKLQRGIPAIPIPSLSASFSAFANDVSPALVYAQLVFALGKKNDVLICLSTSGNSKNAVEAARVAKAIGITTVALTGANDSELSRICDITVRAPATETYKVQEYHLPIYHAICADVENILFGE